MKAWAVTDDAAMFRSMLERLPVHQFQCQREEKADKKKKMKEDHRNRPQLHSPNSVVAVTQDFCSLAFLLLPDAS